MSRKEVILSYIFYRIMHVDENGKQLLYKRFFLAHIALTNFSTLVATPISCCNFSISF